MDTFKINGNDIPLYQLSNRELVDIVRDENTSEADRKAITDYIVNRFENKCCPRTGEGHEEVFARAFGDYVNSRCHGRESMEKVAKNMARDHRYLQQEMFKVCLEYIKVLGKNYADGIYDGRNEWACKVSKGFLDYCKENDIWI